MCLFVDILRRTQSKKLLELFYKERIGMHTNLPELSKGILGYSSEHVANISTVSNNIQQLLYIVPAHRSQHKESDKNEDSSKISSGENGDEGSIYMLQTIRVGNTKINCFSIMGVVSWSAKGEPYQV